MLYREIKKIKTKRNDFLDLTDEISKILDKCEIKEGVCNIFLKATTAGLMINENDLLLKNDFKKFFNDIAEENKLYTHPENAFSHIRASMLNKNITIPISNGKPLLGKWQSILLWEFDTNDREREIIITVSD